MDNLFSGTDARERLANGIRKVSLAVGGTMGTGGHNALIETLEYPQHMLTNDGITIAQSIHLADPIENIGKNILLESIRRANKQSGDGSSTTCVLTAAIIEEGLKHLSEASPMEIKKSLEECMPIIEDSINKQKRDITVDTVGQVASISAEDEQIGAMIQEIYQQIGKDGIIHWDIAKDFTDHYTIGKGITMDFTGFVSPYMADLDEKTGAFQSEARWTKPKILITKQKITSANEFNGLFETLFNKDIKEIVVFCDEYEPNIVSDLIRTRAVRGFKTLLIKMPTLWKDWWYEDLAKATGATVIDPNAGISFKLMKEEHLGTCEHITVTKDTTYLDGIQDVTAHIQALHDEATDDSLLRASRLNTKTARYFVGAASDSALSYRRLKVEDAIASAWQALQNGVVAGGGVALRVCTSALESDTIGSKILAVALLKPEEQITTNAGYEVFKQSSNNGIDSRTGKAVDMFDAGIVDPANVVLNSIRNAVSVAASVLTAPVVITLPAPKTP